MLLELVYSEDKCPNLTSSQRDHLQLAFEMSVANLRERLINSEVGEVFLELFEDEIKSMKALQFEDLITNYDLLMPIPHGPQRGFSFAMRLPEGDLEETKKAVQEFLRTRKLQDRKSVV